jgi:hypothetical protein
MLASSTVTVGTSPVLLATAGGTPMSVYISGNGFASLHIGDATIASGGTGITASDLSTFSASGAAVVVLGPGDELYGVAGSSTTVQVMTIGC